MMIDETEPRRALTTLGITLCALLVTMLVFGMGKLTGFLDPLVARRGVGTVLGLMLVATGNFVPKLRLFQPATGTAHSDAIDRFAGRIFVACGLAFAAVFLFAPADRLFILSPIIVLAGFLGVFARWLAWNGKRPHLTVGRLMLTIMLATIAWTGAIFFADAAWGDDVSRWMAILSPFMLISAFSLRAARRRGTYRR
jgi:hypothetical protein